jgi:hypothetical protein
MIAGHELDRLQIDPRLALREVADRYGGGEVRHRNQRGGWRAGPREQAERDARDDPQRALRADE